MQGSSDNSFIPKRGAAKRRQVSGSRHFYIFTYISYILMFAALLSAAGVYLYAQYIGGLLDTEVEKLNAEIGSFSQADMEKVTKFDLRLAQAKGRLENSVSVVSVFEALQAATIDSVQIESLRINREMDDKFIIEATVQTDSFDSTIFQRGVLLRNGTVQKVEISQLNSNQQSENKTDTSAVAKPRISFQAKLDIPLTNVPADPQSYQVDQLESSDEIDQSTAVTEQDGSEISAGQDIDSQSFNEEIL